MSATQARNVQDESEPTGNAGSFAERSKGPALSLKAGHGVVIKNWRNAGQNGDYFTTAVEVSYKPEGGEWVTNKVNLNEDQLAGAILTMQEAHRNILLERSQQQSRSR